ncbi:MAG: class I adenylate-forming enzyme family protein [Bdellovibrionota bacterium]
MTDRSFVKYLPGGELAPSYAEKPILGVFTSGTIAGKPRLVLYSKSNIESSLDGILALFDREKIDSIFSYPQPFHTFGLLLGYVLALKLKVPLHMFEGKYSTSAHELRARLRNPGLLTLGTPAHFYDLIHYVESKSIKLPASYTAIIGGAPVRPELWIDIKTKLGIDAPSIGYGCTEASPGITHQIPGLAPTEAGEIGRPLPGIIAEITADQGVEIRGPSLCTAIIDSDGVTFPKSLLIRDRLIRRDDGNWIFKERIDLVINRGGAKISLEEVERTIAETLKVTCIAVGVLDVRLGEELALVITGAADTAVVQSVTSLVKERLGLAIPESRIVFLEKFPLNAAAKIDRKMITAALNKKLNQS